jgi:hypothetical protein
LTFRWFFDEGRHHLIRIRGVGKRDIKDQATFMGSLFGVVALAEHHEPLHAPRRSAQFFATQLINLIPIAFSSKLHLLSIVKNSFILHNTDNEDV